MGNDDCKSRPELTGDYQRDRRLLINMLMREAEFTGPGSSHAARVKAASLLADLLFPETKGK